MKKKVKLLTPGKIREQTVDSKSDGTGSDTMIVDENGHEEAGIEPLLQEKWASSQSYSGAQVEHSASLLSASEDDDNDEDLDDEDDDDDSEYNRPHWQDTTATSILLLDIALLPSKQCGTYINREPKRKGQWSTTHKLHIHFA